MSKIILQTMTEDEAKEKAATLMGSYPRTDFALPEVYLRQLTKALRRYPPNLADKILSEFVDEYRGCPSIAAVVSSLNEAVTALRKNHQEAAAPAAPAAPTTSEYTPKGWEAPGIRNKAATAAMMRLLVKTIASRNATMHQMIVDVNKDPADWPKFLDQHGDKLWKNREQAA